MPIFTKDELALIHEALDQLAEVYMDTLHHDMGDLSMDERKDIERDSSAAAAMRDRILPYIR